MKIIIKRLSVEYEVDWRTWWTNISKWPEFEGRVSSMQSCEGPELHGMGLKWLQGNIRKNRQERGD